MKTSIYRIVFRVEFDGDVRFFLTPQKSMFLSISIDFFDVFLQFFRFPSFRKNLDFFFPCRRRAEIFAAAAAAAAAAATAAAAAAAAAAIICVSFAHGCKKPSGVIASSD